MDNKNEKLSINELSPELVCKSIIPFKDPKDSLWYMKLVYESDVAIVTLPKVELGTMDIDEYLMNEGDYPNDSMILGLDKHYFTVRQGDGFENYFYETHFKKRKMTLEEIEYELGYEVEIVNGYSGG